MNAMLSALKANSKVTQYKINENKTEGYQLFFVKDKLETVRTTDTKETQVTVYAEEDGYMGDAAFKIYPYTSEQDLPHLVEDAVQKARAVHNPAYALPPGEAGEYRIESNFAGHPLSDVAQQIAHAVFSVQKPENASLNAVEIFVSRHTEHILNSCGADKTQVRYSAMVEAIPTYTGPKQSVELYQALNFSQLDEDWLTRKLMDKLHEVKARYEAVPLPGIIGCPVVFRAEELSQLFRGVAEQLSYETVYAHAGVFSKGEPVQRNASGDRLTLSMVKELPGSVKSSLFDDDGSALRNVCIVKDGVVERYHGSSRFGQYLHEQPTGKLSCMDVAVGTMSVDEINRMPHLEILSMSGLQMNFFTDYIGGEVRLAYYFDGETIRAYTGFFISGKLSDVLSSLRLGDAICTENGYRGPEKGVLFGMNIL